MKLISDDTGETKAQTLARKALEQYAANGNAPLSKASYWSQVDSVAKLWRTHGWRFHKPK